MQTSLLVQRQVAGSGNGSAAPPIVHDVMRSPGQTLPPATRGFMESRFGHDFSQVRVHTDAQAAESARAVNARAYTVGRDIAFGSGQYAPGSSTGQHLLAHELAHVMQQQSDNTRLQRSPDDTAKRTDVVLLMAAGLETEALVLAPKGKVLKVSTLEEMTTALKNFGSPIGTLFFIAHALPSGDLGFETGEGTKFELPSNIANALKGSVTAENAPKLIDFRGCSLGTSPQAMDLIRSALGGGAAVGGNCFNLTQIQGPVLLGKKAIAKPSQVTATNRSSFETGLQMLIDSFGDAKDCILNASEEGYFKAGGKMVAQWFSPEYSTDWDNRKSRCYADLTPEVVDPSKAKEGDYAPGIAGHCRLIRVEKKTGVPRP